LRRDKLDMESLGREWVVPKQQPPLTREHRARDGMGD